MHSFLRLLGLIIAVSALRVLALPSWIHLGQGADDGKYFHEPGTTDLLGHYDTRYFTTLVTEQERADTLRHLVRAYLKYFDEQHLDTWIAHGTLLGWFWNGKILPWDWDVDVQVAHQTLLYIGERLNGTVTEYPTDDGSTRTYLLDVNPHSRVTGREDGKNIIDARFIDMRNGLYIDITGLHESNAVKEPGVIQCKNDHKYLLSDIYPLRRSRFEGVGAWIPYRYNEILKAEYPKGLTSTSHYSHDWDDKAQRWVPNQEYLNEAADRDAKAMKFRAEVEAESQEVTQR
ncbi:hypothetical protein KEM52_006604 [Ascosphaera acerosa]|nr:hypothetical protein KEM52_006604 [Ascosphaera acerosa]